MTNDQIRITNELECLNFLLKIEAFFVIGSLPA